MDMSTSYNIAGRMGVSPLDEVSCEPAWKPHDTLDFVTAEGVTACVYLQAGTGGVFAGALCRYDSGVAVAASPTDDAARPLCVALNTMAAGRFGWFAVRGTVPVAAAATTPAGGRVYMSGTAGQTTPTASAGKAILNAVYSEDKTITAGYQLVLATIQHPTQEAPDA